MNEARVGRRAALALLLAVPLSSAAVMSVSLAQNQQTTGGGLRWPGPSHLVVGLIFGVLMAYAAGLLAWQANVVEAVSAAAQSFADVVYARHLDDETELAVPFWLALRNAALRCLLRPRLGVVAVVFYLAGFVARVSTPVATVALSATGAWVWFRLPVNLP